MAQGRFRAFLFGGILGAGAALLFAPRSGKETRAYLTDKAEEMWGEGTDIYSQGYERIKAEAANVQRTAVQANDELRDKIENARTAIAEQIAKNAQSARDAINAKIPLMNDEDTLAAEADVLKGQIPDAATEDTPSQDETAGDDAPQA
ncbi:MAG: YtxH domain-containing protein [Coriobacteriales bacterium]|jgi:gas vesicle protein|nr:YtxH domain-containing protein [Coriobacteriales bacterium]